MLQEPNSPCQCATTSGATREARIIESIESLWGARPDSGGVVRGDDCAVLELPGLAHDLLITTDQVVEGSHFVWGRHSPRDLGRKALVRSLSDVAAMGGWPLFLAQTVCLPAKALAGDWHDKFQQGLRQAATEAGVPGLALLGGDVSSGERFVATVTLVGRAKPGRALLRSGAQPGDGLFVSGVLGGSSLGLRRLLAGPDTDRRDAAVRRHCVPSARIALGLQLAEVPATAAIDVSDGLGLDLGRLASASGVMAVVEQAAVPVFPGASHDDALSSGEEYELLFTLPAGTPPPEAHVVSRIGWIERGAGAWVQGPVGRRRIDAAGFSHFAAG